MSSTDYSTPVVNLDNPAGLRMPYGLAFAAGTAYLGLFPWGGGDNSWGTRRLGLALAAALVISLGVTSVFYVRITRAQAGGRPQTRRVVAARVALQPGTPIAAENLTEIDWPKNVALDGLIERKRKTSRVMCSGMRRRGKRTGAAARPGRERQLRSCCQDSRRHARECGQDQRGDERGRIYFPGSRVDVLVTLRGENNNASTTTARTVLQNVQVLSTGTKMDPDPTGKPREARERHGRHSPGHPRAITKVGAGAEPRHDPVCSAQWRRLGESRDARGGYGGVDRSSERPTSAAGAGTAKASRRCGETV